VSSALQVLRAFPIKPRASKIQENRIQTNTVAVQCKVHLVLDSSNKGPVGSNPNWNMSLYPYLYIYLCYLDRGLAKGKSPNQVVLQTV